MTNDEARPVEQTTKGGDGDTRRRIMLALLEYNPASAGVIAEDLGLSAAGVRRHLDILVDEGLAETAPAPSSGPRGRGRPAKSFRLTAAGREQFGHGYDALATAALEALRDAGGDAAVTAFAERRVAEILSGVTPVSEGADREDVVRAVAEAFRRHGYAATVNETAGNIQICHHHCPISHVAHDFPQLCAAEHEALSNLLGQHIQPLATIADGNGICTTNIPIRPITPTSAPAERSGQ